MINACLVVGLAAVAALRADLPSLSDTNYPVPGDAIFVSTTGSDSHSGNLDAPLRTIARAIEQADDGATVVIRQGVYRETIGGINKRLTLQPYPHETVWIKGSLEISNWLLDGDRWKHDYWPQPLKQNSYDSAEITTRNSLAGSPDMVFRDGRPLTQVAQLSALDSSAFYVDNDTHVVYVIEDPGRATLEVAKYGYALELYRGASGSIIRGLGFAHFANVKYEGAVRVLDGASDITLESNTFADNAGSSLLIYDSPRTTIRSNTFIRAGYQGLSTWKSHELLLEQNRFDSNNSERFEIEGALAGAAGAKIFASNDVIARSNEFIANHCTGLWLDGSCYACKVIRNRFDKNELAGLHIEESAKVMVVENHAADNSGAGIYVSNSSDVRIYNNQLIDNAPNMSVQDDSRVNTNTDELKKGISYITAHVQFVNNVLAVSKAAGPMLWARDYNSTPQRSAREMIDACDYNCWQFPKGSNVTLIEWWDKSTRVPFSDLKSFRTATNREAHGFESTLDADSPVSPKVSDEILPADIRRELGLQTSAAMQPDEPARSN